MYRQVGGCMRWERKEGENCTYSLVLYGNQQGGGGGGGGGGRLSSPHAEKGTC